jgi:enolase
MVYSYSKFEIETGKELDLVKEQADCYLELSEKYPIISS